MLSGCPLVKSSPGTVTRIRPSTVRDKTNMPTPFVRFVKEVADRLERSTGGLEHRCSIQLSYATLNAPLSAGATPSRTDARLHFVLPLSTAVAGG